MIERVFNVNLFGAFRDQGTLAASARTTRDVHQDFFQDRHFSSSARSASLERRESSGEAHAGRPDIRTAGNRCSRNRRLSGRRCDQHSPKLSVEAAGNAESGGRPQAISSAIAAQIILRGIRQNPSAILVGRDSMLLDKLHRLRLQFAARAMAKKMASLLTTNELGECRRIGAILGNMLEYLKA